MKEDDVIQVTVVSKGSREFILGNTYEAQIITMYPNGNHHIWVLDEFNERHFSNMRNSCKLNGGDFKINIGIVT